MLKLFSLIPTEMLPLTREPRELSYSSDGKDSACNAGDLGLTPGSGRSPGERNGSSLQYSCMPRKSLGQRSLVGYNPWAHENRT